MSISTLASAASSVHRHDCMNEWCVSCDCPGFPRNRSVPPQLSSLFIVRTQWNGWEQTCSEVTWSPTHLTVPGRLPLLVSDAPAERSPSDPAQLLRLTAHREHILWRNQSIMWHADLRDTLRNLLMRQDFVSVMLLSCDLLSHSRSLTDETLSVTPLSERSYIRRLVSKWLMDSTGHDGWDIKLCTVQRI